ncbi:MAG: chemotaxis protein CheW [Nitrospirota bacterium]|nr:chemotaxis protein CheW [Nitrospirota bacterium]
MGSLALETERTASRGMQFDRGDTQEFLTFRLADEEYGIPILVVQEIIGYQKPTAIPNAPAWVCGVVNIRGTVIPVVDVRNLFGMPATTYDDTSVIIVNRVNDKVIGAVVDGVNDVLAFTADQMQATPEVSDSFEVRYLDGLGKLDDRLVMLLDMAELIGRGLDGVDKLVSAEEAKAKAKAKTED